MFSNELKAAAAQQLGCDYSCSAEIFDGFVNTVTVAVKGNGRREFSEQPDFFRMATMGKAAVATVSEQILPFAQTLLSQFDGAQLFNGKTQYLINSELKKYNKTIGDINIYYLPQTPYKYCRHDGFQLRVFEQDEIKSILYNYSGFTNALLYSDKKKRKDMLAVCALNGTQLIGMAGASNDSGKFWQIGIDVLEEFRGRGLATELVSALTSEVFMHGAVPYYGTWSGNIASQNVARKSGYYPAWAEMFTLDIE